jgi:hypothetical protein
MKKIKNLLASNGTYINKDGEEKSRWVTVGGLFEDGNKTTIKIDSIPVGGNWNGWLTLVDPDQHEKSQRQTQGQPRQQSRQGSGFDDMPDDIPF